MRGARRFSVFKRPFIDWKALEASLPLAQSNAMARKVSIDIGDLLSKKSALTALQMEIENLTKLQRSGENHKEQLRNLKVRFKTDEDELYSHAVRVPNWSHVDAGKGVVYETEGARQLGRSHWDIALANGWVSPTETTTVCGTRFQATKGKLAALEQALQAWAIARMVRKNYELIIPPDVIRKDFVTGCGFLPDSEAAESGRHVFSVEDSDLLLSGTSELYLMGRHLDTVFKPTALPSQSVAVSHCFRPEVSHGGSDAKGLYRLKQFTKVEMVSICLPDASNALLEDMLQTQIEGFNELGLEFRVVDMAHDELGAPAYRKYDIEAWMPGRGGYGEVSSASNCTDFQTRRLNIRTKLDGKRVFLHSLNATVCAIPRTCVAIIEQFQNKDGSVDFPKVLHPYLAMYGYFD